MPRSREIAESKLWLALITSVSDGRGNVPLKASHRNTITRPVTREGVEDALQQAREIQQMKYVSSFVLSPHLRYYQELPQQLADALNAPFTLVDEEESGQV